MSTADDTSTPRGAPSAGRARRALWLLVDALVSGASGVVLVGAGTLLDDPLGPSAAALTGFGIFFLVYAAALVLLARAGAPVAGVRLVVVGNLLWVVASVAVAVTGSLGMTGAGRVATVIQAIVIALIAGIQFGTAPVGRT